MPNLRRHSCDSRMLRCYDVSTTHVNVYLLQWCVQRLPLASGADLQVAVINIVPQIVWKVCIDGVCILQRKTFGAISQ